MEQTPPRSHDAQQQHERSANKESASAIDSRLYEGNRDVQRRAPYSQATINQHSDWQRARYSWLFEIRPTAEIPVINLRNIIQDDRESIKRLLEDQKMHFEKRCSGYCELDSQVDLLTLHACSNGTGKMTKDAKGNGDVERRQFFPGLKEELRIDSEEVRDE